MEGAGAVLAGGVPELLAKVVGGVDILKAGDGGAAKDVRWDAIGAEAGVDAGPSDFFGCALGGITGRVTFDIVAGLTAE